MTLVACFRGRDGLVLAADSRGTIGNPASLTAINDAQTKLFQLSKFVGIVTYGQAELAAQLITEVKARLEDTDAYFTPVFNKARDTIREKYQEWLTNVPIEHRPVVGFIVGGFEQDGQPKIYYLSSPLDFAPQLCTTGFGLGGIPQYATYLGHRLYDSQMSRKNLRSLAAYVITETASQDPKVGGPIRIAEISQQEGYHELGEVELTEVVKRNADLSKNLREFFFPKEG